jgi:hypothetical protein
VVASQKGREGGAEEGEEIEEKKIEDGIVGGRTGVVAGTVSSRMAKVELPITRIMKQEEMM